MMNISKLHTIAIIGLVSICLPLTYLSGAWADESPEQEQLKLNVQGKEYDIPLYVIQQYPNLIMLIMESPAMGNGNTRERYEWLYLLKYMSFSQVDELYRVLDLGGGKLQAIDEKYSVVPPPTYTKFTQEEQLALAEMYDGLIYHYYRLELSKQILPSAKKAFKIRKQLLGEKHTDTIKSLNNLAFLYQELGQLDEALSSGEEVYRLCFEVLGEKHPITIKSLVNLTKILTKIYRDLGHLDEASPLAEKAYHLYREVLRENNYQLSKKSYNTFISFNFEQFGSLEEILLLLENFYPLATEVIGENHPETLTILNNLAVIYRDLGHLYKALPLFEKSYSLTKEVLGEKHHDTLASMNNLATIYRELGYLSDALFLYEKCYSLTEKVLGERNELTIDIFYGLASLYDELGRLAEAVSLYQKSYHLAVEVLGTKNPRTFVIINNLALVYKQLGFLREAIAFLHFNLTSAMIMFGRKHPYTLLTFANLHKVENELANGDDSFVDEYYLLEAKEYHSQLVETLGEKHPLTLTFLARLAKAHKDLGFVFEALSLHDKAYSLNKEVLGEKHPNTLASLNNLAMIYVSQGNIDGAIIYFERLTKSVEMLRRENLSAINRQFLFKQWVHSYFMLSNLYVARFRFSDAFRIAEMSKARTLLESLAAKLAAQQSGLTPAEQQQLREYDARLAFLNNSIASKSETIPIAKTPVDANRLLEEKIALEAEKNKLVSKLNQFHTELMEKYPKYAQLSDVQIVGAKEGAKSLPADAVLISYLVDGNRVLAFTLQADGTLTAHDLGKIPNFKKELASYRRVLSLPKGDTQETPFRLGQSQPQEKQSLDHLGKPQAGGNRGTPLWFGPSQPEKQKSLSRTLGKYLLEPLKDIIKDKPHWIISPDGPLALIPFETLRFEGEKQPVIAQHQLSYVQSLSVLKLLQERDRAYSRIENRGTLLAMGAPIYQDANTNKEGTTTNCPGRAKRNPNPVDFKIAHALVHRSDDPQRYLRAFRQLDKMTWCNLPGAERELEQLEKLFFSHWPRIYKQAEATEANLQRLNQLGILAEYRYLIFATHGYLNPKVPAMSSIVLGQVNNPPGIDGYVTAGEWPGYNLKSDLMVLSACETGVGEVVSGEGVMGLPYAFYVAGNKNTLLTLWPINDDMTAEFVTRFFTKLKAGQGQIEALTATKREFIKKGGRYSQPVYWAAFVLYGV